MKDMYVYILECNDGSYYTGVTNNVERRLVEHSAGEDKRCYTFNKRPIKLVFWERFIDPVQAIEFEKQVKGWSRAKKKALIARKWEDLPELSKCRNKTSHINYKTT